MKSTVSEGSLVLVRKIHELMLMDQQSQSRTPNSYSDTDERELLRFAAEFNLAILSNYPDSNEALLLLDWLQGDYPDRYHNVSDPYILLQELAGVAVKLQSLKTTFTPHEYERLTIGLETSTAWVIRNAIDAGLESDELLLYFQQCLENPYEFTEIWNGN